MRPSSEGADDRLDEVTTRAEFGALLTAHRNAVRLTINAVATRCGVPRSTVADWCRAHRLPHAGQSDQFASMLRAMEIDETEPWMRALDRIRAQVTRRADAQPNPYPGLASFRSDDAEWFFGRERLTGQAVERCLEVLADDARPSVIAVVGPSGSGKSSLIHAGLCPRLVADGYTVASMTPGARPDERLAELLQDATEPLVLVVDQLEEIFTACDDPDQRERFLARLAAMADGSRPTLVVIGLRIDFYGRAAATGFLSAVLERSQLLVGAMNDDELAEAIIEPARRVGYSVDDELLALVRRDFAPAPAETSAAHDPGALPMLSHALLETWHRARRQRMRAADYLAAGGIDGAVTQTADEAFDQLEPGEQKVARQVFLRLVRVDSGAPITRREADPTEFDGIGGRKIVDRFVSARLLTAKEGSVEIAHESLVSAWPRLQTWISGAREALRAHDQLRQATRYWLDSDRDESTLLRGARLSLVRQLLDDSPDIALSEDEHDFLAASTAAQRRAEAERRRRDRRRYQQLAAAIVLIVCLVGAVVIAVQTGKAADRTERLARSGDIAGKSERLRARSPELAAQLALVAYRTDPTVTARSALLDTTAYPLPERYVDERHPAIDAVPVDGGLAVATKDGGLTLRPGSGNARTKVLIEAGDDEKITEVAASESAPALAAASDAGTVRLWRGGTPDEDASVLPGRLDGVTSLAISRDGRTLAAGAEDGRIRLWRVGGTTRLLDGPHPGVTEVAFAPDGNTLIAAGRDRKVHRFDVRSPASPRSLAPLGVAEDDLLTVAYSPDGKTVAAGDANGDSVYVWNVANPRKPRRVATLTEPQSWVESIAFSPDGRHIAAASGDSTLWIWDARSYDLAGNRPHPVAVDTTTYLGNDHIVTVAEDGVVRTWPSEGPAYTGTKQSVYALDFLPSGKRLLLAPKEKDNTIHQVDSSGQASLDGDSVRLRHSGRQQGLSATAAYSPDGRYAAAGTQNGGLYIWDIARRRTGEIAAARVAQDGLSWIDYHPRKPYVLASARTDAAIIVDAADPRRPRTIARLDDTSAKLNEARFSPDGSELVTVDDEGGVRLYAFDDPREPRLLSKVSVDRALSPAFDPRGGILAVGSGADKVYLWDISDPAEPTPVGKPLDGPVAEAWQIAFRPNGKHLAAASTDGSVHIWNVADPAAAAPFAVLRAMTDDVIAVTYNPRGDTLAAAAEDGSVRRWISDPARAARWICDHAGTPITRTEWQSLLPDVPYQPPCR